MMRGSSIRCGARSKSFDEVHVSMRGADLPPMLRFCAESTSCDSLITAETWPRATGQGRATARGLKEGSNHGASSSSLLIQSGPRLRRFWCAGNETITATTTSSKARTSALLSLSGSARPTPSTYPSPP